MCKLLKSPPSHHDHCTLPQVPEHNSPVQVPRNLTDILILQAAPEESIMQQQSSCMTQNTTETSEASHEDQGSQGHTKNIRQYATKVMQNPQINRTLAPTVNRESQAQPLPTVFAPINNTRDKTTSRYVTWFYYDRPLTYLQVSWENYVATPAKHYRQTRRCAKQIRSFCEP